MHIENLISMLFLEKLGSLAHIKIIFLSLHNFQIHILLCYSNISLTEINVFLYQSIMSRKRTYRGQLIVTSIHIHVHVNIRKRVDCLRYIKKKGGG